MIIKLHFDKKWTVDAIVEFMEMPILDVKKIIKKHIADQRLKA